MTGEQLTAWRLAENFNRAEAARELGCARNSIIAWENGKAEIPRYIELACLAIAHKLHQAPAAEAGAGA
jgi:transcriptional regulator with XRE-family HTH domain